MKSVQYWCNGSALAFQANGRGSIPLYCFKLINIAFLLTKREIYNPYLRNNKNSFIIIKVKNISNFLIIN